MWERKQISWFGRMRQSLKSLSGSAGAISQTFGGGARPPAGGFTLLIAASMCSLCADTARGQYDATDPWPTYMQNGRRSGVTPNTEVVSGGIAGAESQRSDATIRIYFGGDVNGDGAVDNLDIAPFALALTDPAQYSQMFPLVDANVIGDVNEDGALNNLDISPFAALLTGGASSVPEPPTALLAVIAMLGLGALRLRR